MILSVDSMQVYRGMDIGTAKPDAETRERIDYRMLDICDPSQDLSVQRFQKLAREHIAEILAADGRVIIVGGSGLHFRAVVDPMTFAPTDPTLREDLEAMSLLELREVLVAADATAGDHVDLANPRRVVRAVEVWKMTGQTPTQRSMSPEANALRRYESYLPFRALGVDAGESSRMLIETRLARMLDAGFMAEVANLEGRLGTAAARAVGYREFLGAVRGEVTVKDAFADTLRSTNALVKRQRTFFRRDPRIEWLTWQDDDRRRVRTAVDGIGETMQWTS
ncbi:MAG: tRNA (adenosine(37)-N6)-dimethylallyltransferase MiaA [Acidimicrobiia bacterium]|nr:MAG: tRNA (adenosine(37)-N6)-dimethylallyltransferase MiaA [Acidimicrobiia bacterium]